jgi:nitrite reductase/ring-hydroxylating ferredoxin subunit
MSTEQDGVAKAFETIRSGNPVRVYNGKKAVRVLDSDEVPEGAFAMVEAERHSIGITRIAGGLHAIRNECPHNGAELCKGTVSATYPPGEAWRLDEAELEGRILACPWHGRQFDVVTGQALYESDVSALTYEVWEDGDGVYVRV